ncbi:MAG: DUF1538 domain-containing protein [Clostridiales bacterium]|nr:DUF1538 domain-containing protein [Clostridiales bacterium]
MVVALHFTAAPLPWPTFALFCVATVMLVAGMGLFTLGVERSMTPMGELLGSDVSRRRNLPLMLIVGLIAGVAITVAEPDLQVLAEQVPAFPNAVLVWAVAAGVGAFMMLAMLRVARGIPLNIMLLVSYAALFGLSLFSNPDFLPVAFDSGGVTTGPITVPLILALGMGVAAVRSGPSAEGDSFGAVGLCSIGPIAAVLLLGFFFDPSSSEFAPETARHAQSMAEVMPTLGHALAKYSREVTVALTPIAAFFALYQVIWLRLPGRRLLRMAVGLAYAFVGLTLFLAGVNGGFLPAANWMGNAIASRGQPWLLAPLGMALGFFVVRAEPAVHVLTAQVEEITDGAISRRALMLSLSLGVAAAAGLAMIRVLTGLPIQYFLWPGYIISVAMSFFVPKIFTAIAFDSGGIASGPMTASFMLPFAMGASAGLGGSMMADAFGLVAMVAMVPLIAIQLLALVYAARLKRADTAAAAAERMAASDEDVIEFE